MARVDRSRHRLRALGELPVGEVYALALMLDADDPRQRVFSLPLRRDAEGAGADPVGEDAFTAALLAEMGVPGQVVATTVLRGEQTNLSIVATLADGTELVVKLFRTVQHGDNPDVELQRVLSDAGADFVPRFAGALERTWTDAAGADGRGHLAVAQEFVRGASDGWVLATAAARDGDTIAGPARALGAATARMHAILAERLPTRTPTADDIRAQTALWRSRLDEAVAAAAVLGAWRDPIEAAYDAATHAAWPPLQRIHGDLHLGQLLHRDERWVFLDFEGEPLRTLAERTAPEPALRDVAGMLRSFDYAAGSDGAHRPDWAAATSAAYLAGYADAAGAASLEPAALLRALTLDKAVYEVLYEATHRPGWLPIPLAAIERLTADQPAP